MKHLFVLALTLLISTTALAASKSPETAAAALADLESCLPEDSHVQFYLGHDRPGTPLAVEVEGQRLNESSVAVQGARPGSLEVKIESVIGSGEHTQIRRLILKEESQDASGQRLGSYRYETTAGSETKSTSGRFSCTAATQTPAASTTDAL